MKSILTVCLCLLSLVDIKVNGRSREIKNVDSDAEPSTEESVADENGEIQLHFHLDDQSGSKGKDYQIYFQDIYYGGDPAYVRRPIGRTRAIQEKCDTWPSFNCYSPPKVPQPPWIRPPFDAPPRPRPRPRPRGPCRTFRCGR